MLAHTFANMLMATDPESTLRREAAQEFSRHFLYMTGDLASDRPSVVFMKDGSVFLKTRGRAAINFEDQDAFFLGLETQQVPGGHPLLRELTLYRSGLVMELAPRESEASTLVHSWGTRTLEETLAKGWALYEDAYFTYMLGAFGDGSMFFTVRTDHTLRAFTLSPDIQCYDRFIALTTDRVRDAYEELMMSLATQLVTQIRRGETDAVH